MAALRVLHIIDPGMPGGGPCALRLLADVIAHDAGEGAIEHDVMAIGTNRDRALAAECGLSVVASHCPPSSRPLSGRWAWQRMLAAREAEAGKYDVIHGWSLRAAAAAALIPTPTRRTGSLHVGPMSPLPVRACRAVLRKHAMPVLASTPAVLAAYEAHGITKHRCVNMLPAVNGNTIVQDDRAALRSRWGLDEDTFVVGALGEPASALDARILMRAVVSVHFTGRKLAMVAPEQMHHRADARWWGRRLGLEQLLVFDDLAEQPWRVVPGLDLALFTDAPRPGSGAHTSPQPLLWAMAAGLPVIAQQCDVNSGIVADGENGRLVPRDSFSALCDVVAELHDERDMAARLGRAAATYAREHAAVDAYAERLNALYDRLAAM